MRGIKARSDSFHPPLSLEVAQLWAEHPGWKLREAPALLLGLDPSQNVQDASPAEPEFKRLNDLRSIASRAVTMKIIASPSPPLEWITWMATTSFEPSPLIKEAFAFRNELPDFRKLYHDVRAELDVLIKSSTTPSEKSSNTLYTIIAALCLNLEEDWPETSLTKLVTGLIDDKGMSVTSETVRKALHAATDYLPGGNKGPDRIRSLANSRFRL